MQLFPLTAIGSQVSQKIYQKPLKMLTFWHRYVIISPKWSIFIKASCVDQAPRAYTPGMVKKLWTFKEKIFSFIQSSPNSVYNCHIPKGIKFIARLRLGLSHMREHKFKHNFQDPINPLNKWSLHWICDSFFSPISLFH